MKYILFALIAIVLLSGCSQKAPENAQIANPASVYCEEHSGTLELRNAPEGQTGYCKFADGTECEEWAYYRGECPRKATTKEVEVEPAAETNEEQNPVSISSSIESNCIGFVIGGEDEASTIAQAKAAWERPHEGPFVWERIEPSKGEFDFEKTDRWVQAAQENNVAILATVWPYAGWDQSKCHDASCEVASNDQFYPYEKMGYNGGIPKSRCKPCSMEDYKTFVTKLVERYDGDGKEDMEGLETPIKYWEVLNEPEMKGGDLAFFKGTEAEYAEILSQSYSAIKAACPNCKVLHAGAAGTEDWMLAFWGKVFDSSKDFDIANIHFIMMGDKATLNVKDFKALLASKGISKPIWVTEAEYESSADVASSFSGALKEGASKVFFTRFEVGKRGPPTPGVVDLAYDGLKC
ncbi:MAG TPA: DUF333 domain-containing protein [Nanoarchaeota archaeon]|nr:DUF333 domain-containing protein [Nanoarchaeota archaeon]